MNKSTQANAKKEERRARRLAQKLFISYVVQNPGAIRIIKKNDTIFNSVSNFKDFILDENNPKNLKFAKRTASFIEKKSDDLEQLLKLLDQYPDALNNIRVPDQMLKLLSNSDIQIAGKSAQKVLDNPEVIESLASVSDFIIENDTVSSFSEYLKSESQQDVPPSVAIVRFIKDNPDKAQTFMEFIEQNSSDITRIATFLQEPENADLASALGLPQEGHEVAKFLAVNSEQIQPAVSMIQNEILKNPELSKKLLDAAEDVALFMDKEENRDALKNISQTISGLQNNGIEPFSLEGLEQVIDKNSEDLKNVLTFIEKHPKDLEIFGDFLNKNIEYTRLFGLNKNDAESMKSFLEILKNNPEKIQPAAMFTKNLMDFYKGHPNCKEITNFYKQGDNAEQISNLIDQMSKINLNDPKAINGMLNNEDFKDTFQTTAKLIRDNSGDIVAFADFLLSEENSELVNKLTEGIDGAENTAKSVKDILQFTIKEQEKLKPAANVLYTALEFDSKHPDIRKSLFNLYQDVGPGLKKFISDCNDNTPTTKKGWVSLVDRNSDSVRKVAEWISNNKEHKKEIGHFIKDHKDDMETLLGTDTSTLNTIADYMVDTPWYIDFAIDNFDATLKIGKIAAWLGLISDADIKKTDDPNESLLATADMMKKDQKRAEEKSQNIVPNESLLATADIMKKDKKRAEEKSQNIAQSMKESPKETKVPTQIPLSHNKENFYS